MNIHEAAALMARIVDTWPAGRWPNGTIAEWTKDLSAFDKATAERARVVLKKTHAVQPMWAQFVAAYRAATPREEWQFPLEENPLATKDRGLEHIAAIRTDLRSRGRPA